MSLLRLPLLAAALVACFDARACTWDDIGARYGIHPYLLAAVAQHESNLDPTAIRKNKNGSRDIGLMQINSVHLPELAKHGITEQDLLNPCTNLAVGAWLMKRHQNNYGNTWEAVGVYHSATPDYKWKYAQKIQKTLDQLVQKYPPSQR
jgi:soluble lytic murein transglycosylase-like protein